MSTKAKQYVEKMEASNILMEQEMTFVEYVEELIQFQEMVTRTVMGDEYEEGMRIDEAIYRLESKARAKGINYDHQFRKGIAALKTVSKEISISLAGKKGENLVAKTLEYVTRPNTTMFRNVYVSDGVDETELDNVVLTDNGIIILEIKNTKDDVTITEQGRLVHSGDECYDKKPLCEKMEKKRRLLKARISAALEEKGIDIPLSVESLIVFSSPKGVRVNVDDRFHREKWCFRTGLVNKIDYYVGFASYSAEQLAVLGEVLGEIETQVKRFALTVDFNTVRTDIAEALAMFDEEAVEEVVITKQPAPRKVTKKSHRSIIDMLDVLAKRSAVKRTAAVMAGAITGMACVGILSATTIVRR